MTTAVTTAAVEAAASMSAAKAAAAAGREASRLPAVVITAEGPGMQTALSVRLPESSSGLLVAAERMWRCARMVVDAAATAVTRATATANVISHPAIPPAAIVVATVVKRIAARVIAIVIVDDGAAVPVGAPVSPAPAKTAEEADSESSSEEKVWPAKPDSGIGIPIRPRRYGIAVNDPRVVGRNVNNIRLRGLNDDGRTLSGHVLLLSGFQISRLLRFLAHHLDRVHHVLLLVVIGIAQRRGPGQVFIHVAEDRWKGGERFYAGVPILLVDRFCEIVALQI